MSTAGNEEERLRSAALRNAESILIARQRAERDLIAAKEALEHKTQELLQERRWFEVTLSSIGDAVIATDAEGKVTFLNPIAEAMTGWASPEARGKPLEVVFQIINEDTRQTVDNPVRKVLQTGTTVELANHTALIGRNGVVVAIEDSAAPIRDASGKVSGVVMVFRDVTQRRRAEEALRASEERFRATFEQAAVGIAIAGLDNRFLEANERLCEILGYSLEELRGGLTFTEITHPQDLPATRIRVGRLLAGEIPHYVLEKRYVRKDGATVWSRTTVTLLRKASGEADQMVGIIEDITGRKRAEAALHEARTRLEVSLDSAEIGTWTWDVPEDHVVADGNLARLLTDSPGGAIGGSLQEYLGTVHPADRDRVRNGIAAILVSESANYEMDYRLRRQDGSIRWVVGRGKVERDADGKPVQLLGVVIDITDRKRAEDVAKRGALRLHLALSSGNLGDWVWDAETDLVSLSAHAAGILGLAPDTPIARARMLDRVDADDVEPVRLAIAKALSDRSDCHIEYRMVSPSGKRPWLALRGHGVYAEDGALIAMVGVVQDVTDRKQAEEARSRIAAIVESSDDAIVSKTLDGVITTWNQAAERMFGYTAAEIIGKPVTLLIPANHVDEEPAILDRLKRGERIDHYQTVRMRKDGTLLSVSLTVSPIKDANGRIIGASKIARDITQSKRAEEELREETRILELLNATGPAIGAQLDLQALVHTVTAAATQLSGARFGAFFRADVDAQGAARLPSSLVGATTEEFQRLGLAPGTPLFNATVRGGTTVRADDITKDPRSGAMASHPGMRVRSYLAMPVIARSGDVIGGLFFGHPEAGVFTARVERLIVGVAAQAAIALDNASLLEAAQREIAQRERAEATLRETDRRKDEFLATLAHELRNPLAPIRQAALISTAAGATDAQKRWSHDVIARQVHHMGLLLDDLLDVSRITLGTLGLRTEMTDLAAVIDAAVEIARPAIDAKRHRFFVEMPPAPVHLAADPLRLAQVLANLLTNAAKYTDPEGQIRLRAGSADGTVTISVTDNGIGIPPGAIGRVFAMFAQVESSRDRSEGGLGIGLALAKGLVELHGGRIEAKSAGTGRGSEFTVRLPLRSVGPRRLEEPQGSRGEGSKPWRVLIADDNRDAAESLAMLLRMDGHEVTVVHDGEQALAAFATVQPEVALLDIGMPGLNGYEVARRVRQGSLGRAVTLVAVTGWGQDSDKARALAAGFNHHFTKPLDPARLSELLRGLRH